MNSLNYRHNINSNNAITRAAIKKGRARKSRLKMVCSTLAAMFFMGGIMTVIIVCDYIKQGLIAAPWDFLCIFCGGLLCAVGFWFGIKGFQE